jgi:hypothetical protein
VTDNSATSSGQEDKRTMAARATLVKPPPVDESKAPIENALELTELSIIAPVSTSSHNPYLHVSYSYRIAVDICAPGEARRDFAFC